MSSRNRFEGQLAMFSIGIRNAMAFKSDVFLSVVFRFATPLLMLFVWTSVYLGSSAQSIGGLTLPFMYAYYFMTAALGALAIGWNLSEQMQEDIRHGNITAPYTKPMSYIAQVLLRAFSESIPYAAVGVPLLAIGIVLAGAHVTLLNAALFVAMFVLAVAILTLMGYFVGTMAIYFTEIWGIMDISGSAMFMLSGGTVPLMLFPQWVQGALSYTPFPVLNYAPIATLLGVATTHYAVMTLLISGAWVAGLLVLAYFWWGRVRRRITAAGG